MAPGRKTIAAAAVEARADELMRRKLRLLGSAEDIKSAFALIDLTSLNSNDTEASIERFCTRALKVREIDPRLTVAAVCVYPNLAACAAAALRGSGIPVASVAGGFPTAMTTLSVKLVEIEAALTAGAQEIDAVMPLGPFLERRFSVVAETIREMKAVCGPVPLKLILENSELHGLQDVYDAGRLALDSGADFIKASTGKTERGASVPDVLVMLEATADFESDTGRQAGVKPAGGIKTTEQAAAYYEIFAQASSGTPSSRRFRLGASSLAADLLQRLASLSGDRRAFEAFQDAHSSY
jgi:deoxyribose-phosphate aldolase